MNRRTFLTAAFFSALSVTKATPVYAQQSTMLRDAYLSLSRQAQMTVQNELTLSGFLGGEVGGGFTDDLADALENAAGFLQENSNGRIVVDLSSAQGASNYMLQLASLELSAWLYGEGAEADY